MIIIKIIGGLGNQMFQYALGRRIAYTRQALLKLDISGFKTYKLRKYSLKHLNIVENIASTEEVNQFINPQGIKAFIRPSLEKFKPYYRHMVVRQKFFHFDPNILKTRDNVYLIGHWASEKHFKDIESIIRKEFKCKKPSDTRNKIMLKKIRQCDSISLHVRRKDFISNKATYAHHGVCSLAYYKEAVKLIGSKVKNPVFFVFSDDPKWAKENIKPKSKSFYLDYNGKSKDYEDLRLMSYCKHNIIANSTFSWWGAWLNKNNKKIVITPKQWFNKSKRSLEDLLPQDWLRI